MVTNSNHHAPLQECYADIYQNALADTNGTGTRCAMQNDKSRYSTAYSKYLYPRYVPEKSTDLTNAVTLLPGTTMNGSTNILEQFILCALVKKIKPQTILEIGTFKGSTTWHLYENAPPEAVIYTLDLPDDEVPEDMINADRYYATNKRRPFLQIPTGYGKFSSTARNGTACSTGK